MYFDSNLQIRPTKVPQNDDGEHGRVDKFLLVFKYPCHMITHYL